MDSQVINDDVLTSSKNAVLMSSVPLPSDILQIQGNLILKLKFTNIFFL